MRYPTKWLIAWFGTDGNYRDALERTTKSGCPRRWAERRCSEGETYNIWNISNAETERQVRASLESR